MAVQQRTLLGGGEPEVVAGAAFERLHLDDRSWVDVARDWLRGADTLFDALVETVPWTQGKRWMYERMVDDPRLSCWFPPSEPLPHPALAAVKLELERRYDVPFGSVGLNYYRDGNDSVAWHCDRELREREERASRSSPSAAAARSCCGRAVAATRATSCQAPAICS